MNPNKAHKLEWPVHASLAFAEGALEGEGLEGAEGLSGDTTDPVGTFSEEER